jgi:hypothetical protein
MPQPDLALSHQQVLPGRGNIGMAVLNDVAFGCPLSLRTEAAAATAIGITSVPPRPLRCCSARYQGRLQ